MGLCPRLKFDTQRSVDLPPLQGKNIVGTLIGLLTDSEEEVVVEAARALKCVFFSSSFFILATNNKRLSVVCTVHPHTSNKGTLIPGQTTEVHRTGRVLL